MKQAGKEHEDRQGNMKCLAELKKKKQEWIKSDKESCPRGQKVRSIKYLLYVLDTRLDANRVLRQ